MRKRIITLLLILCTCGAVSAQQGSLKGVIRDTSEQKELPNAVIAILRQSDSVMQAFTRSQPNGSFAINHLPPGQYLLMVTYPKFADYVEPFSLKSDSLLSFGRISLIRKSDLLKEVIITQKASAIRMKGDTLEFKADSFKVKEGATVEELLKKLPGIQVNSKGEITAQGEKVQKVLVDGEEFFGDDPTLVTQNLRADMVDKVQVFDKKSDQAAFTGIDDGQKTKTINLKLKDDKKNGYFGKVSAAGGTGGYFDEQLMVNMFKKKEKLAIYGILSNTGKTGLNWTDRNNYGQNIAGMLDYDENDGFTYNGNNDELDSWNGRYNGQGYPTVKTGGLHYNNKWNDDRQSINGNYKFMQLSVSGLSATSSENILPSSLYFNNQQETFNNQIFRNRADGSYEFKFDSTSSLKITADGGTDHKITGSHFTSEATASDSGLINRSTRDVSTTSDMQTVNSSAIWRKRLAKKGRTISVNFSEKYQANSSGGYLFSQNNFYKKDTLNDQQITDQYKNYHSDITQLDSKITYTEPLSSYMFIAANYGMGIVNSTSNRSSFNKSSTGKYTELDPLYSNDYRFNVFTQAGGLTWSIVKHKLKFNAGSNIGLTSFNQHDIHADTTASRHFVNWYPHAAFTWVFTPQQSLTLRYNGNTTQPSIEQIQPTRTNEDPLNITIGNPGLKPQFNNQFSLWYNDYKVLTQRYVYGNIQYTATQNYIGNRDNVDSSSGKKTSQAVNLNGNTSFSGYLGYSFKWKKPAINIDFNANFNQQQFVNIVNDVLNTTNSGSYTLGNNLSKNKDKKYEFGIGFSATYTHSVSSLYKTNTTSYWTYNMQPWATVFLPWRLELSSSAQFDWRPKTNLFEASNQVRWDASLKKKLLKKDQLQMVLSANDILNQNIGFNRSANSNYITQNTYSTIQRYFLVTLVWNFAKAGSAPPPQQ